MFAHTVQLWFLCYISPPLAWHRVCDIRPFLLRFFVLGGPAPRETSCLVCPTVVLYLAVVLTLRSECYCCTIIQLHTVQQGLK